MKLIKKTKKKKNILEVELIYTNLEEDKKDLKEIKKLFIFTIVDFIAQIIPVIYYVVKELLLNLTSKALFAHLTLKIFSVEYFL